MDQQTLALLREGQALAQEQDWENALAKWNQAIDSAENAVEARSWVATLLAGYGQLAAARAQLETMAQTAPEQAAAAAAQIGLDRWEENQDWKGAVQLMGLSLKLAAEAGNVEQLALTSGNLGNILSAIGSLEAALIHYQNAAAHYERIGDAEWNSMMLASAGGMLNDLERFGEAEETLGRAVRIARERGLDSALALALLNLGSVYGAQQKYSQSRAVHEQALEIAWKIRHGEYVQKSAGNLALDLRHLSASGLEEAEALTARAIEDYRDGQYDWAIFGLQCAAQLADPALAPIGLADIYHALSNVEYTVGKMEAAVDDIEEARQLARQADDDERLAEYSAALSHLLLEQGRIEEAVAPCDEAIAAASRSGADEPLAAALGNRGIIALRRDELRIAETMFRRQYEAARRAGIGQSSCNAANSLGAVYQRMGDLASAQQWYRRCIEESENYRWPAGVSGLINLGAVQTRREAWAEAEKTYRQALDLALARNNADLQFDALFNLGLLLLKTQRAEEAQGAFGRAAALNQQLKDPRKGALLAMHEGLSLQELDRPVEALAKLQEAYAFYRESDWLKAARCAVEAAALLSALDRPEEAMAQILPAVEQMEGRLARLSDRDAWSVHQEEERCFQVFLELALQLGGPTLALLAAERSRGRAFRLALRRREAGHRTRIFDTMQILRQTALEAITSGKTKGLQPEYVDRMIAVLSGAKDPEELELNEAWIKEQARRLNMTIIAYAQGGKDDLYAWVIDSEEIRFRSLDLRDEGGMAGLRRLIGALREQLNGGERGAGSVRPAKKDPDPALRRLHALLIDPLAAWLPKQEGARICFAPWGPLFEIPLCALRDADGRYLVDRYASFVVPSLYFFGSQRETGAGEALVVGEPLPTRDTEFGDLAALPFAAEEARAIADGYQTSALIGAEATREQVIPRLSAARVVHLAAHGLFNEYYPLRSAIALTPTPADNGLLYAEDLKKLSLSNRLVVLSACSTALGAITGDGVLGLCREFLTAGTDSVLSSIWAVADRSSAFHMLRFHEALKEKPVLEALREAQLATREQFSSVAQWAPFVLWGWPDTAVGF